MTLSERVGLASEVTTIIKGIRVVWLTSALLLFYLS